MLKTDITAVPEDLKKSRCFFLYKEEHTDSLKDDHQITLLDFDTAVTFLTNEQNIFPGLGIRLVDELGIIALTGCIDQNGEIIPEAQCVLERLRTYSEFDPSGKNVLLYFRAKDLIDRLTTEELLQNYHVKLMGFELYLSGHIPLDTLMTGNRVPGTPKEIREISGDLQTFLEKFLKREAFSNLSLKKASSYPLKDTLWLWYPYIPFGAITILSASPGEGKTYLATWIAAQISTGAGFPINNEYSSYRNRKVVYLSWEDDYARTLIPRFVSNGGDPEHLYCMPKDKMPSDFCDPVVEQIIQERPALIIFDALSSFMGSANINRFNDVRAAIRPLIEWIEDKNIAILVIAHNNKMTSVTSAQDRVSGSVDFTALIRSGLSIGKDPDNEDRLIMAQFKNNLEAIGESLAFSYRYNSQKLPPSLIFDETVTITADELLGAPKKKRPIAQRLIEDMNSYLTQKGGSCPAREIKEHLYKLGYKDASINRAKKELGVTHSTVRQENRNITTWTLAF